MKFDITFVDFIDRYYRRRYRVIERIGEVEFSGGIVGDVEKTSTLENIESVAAWSI